MRKNIMRKEEILVVVQHSRKGADETFWKGEDVFGGGSGGG